MLYAAGTAITFSARFGGKIDQNLWSLLFRNSFVVVLPHDIQEL
jgi:hypothetical protein